MKMCAFEGLTETDLQSVTNPLVSLCQWTQDSIELWLKHPISRDPMQNSDSTVNDLPKHLFKIQKLLPKISVHTSDV